MSCRRLIIANFLMMSLGGAVDADSTQYERDIRPLLTEKCGSCHGALRQEAGLRLDHGQLLRRGGDEGVVIDQQSPSDSRLLQRVTTKDLELRMPPSDEGAPLSEQQVNLLSAWIAAGAPSPEDEVIPIGPDQHWAWQTLQRPALPSRQDRFDLPNPIDSFVAAKHAEHDLDAYPLADKATRLRRLYLGLTGLPPTLAQQRRYLGNSAPAAWSNLVDELLQHPTYGERWARHWMDVWRYSDWDGYKDQLRGSQRHIWRWRDWIIESLNRDKGYDQMIVEMLAGDELAPDNDEVLRATGFLARNYHKSNRNIWLDATVEHTAKAFLAMTINCARCHDHKYDPLQQREYYAFRAIFEPHEVRVDRLEGQPDIQLDGLVRAFDAKPEAPTYLYVAGNEKHVDKTHSIIAAVPQVFGLPLEVEPVELPVFARHPSLRPFVEREELAVAQQAVAETRQQLLSAEGAVADDGKAKELVDAFDLEIARLAVAAAEAELDALKARWEADKSQYLALAKTGDVAGKQWAALAAEQQANLATTRLGLKQKNKALMAAEQIKDPTKKQDSVDKAKKEVELAQKQHDQALKDPEKNAEYTSVGEVYPRLSSGRRLALARWITRPDNPLAARVAVNYVWMHHLGKPLVANVFDFGLRSPEPVYRDLLDWLAVELIESDWSLKHLHRLIVTSRTYQLASTQNASTDWQTNERVDPDNRFLWRGNVRRLEAEVIRDSLFFVAGNLDRQHGGPEIDFSKGETVRRRSIYFRHAYEKQMTMLVLFDAAAPTECYQRSPSIIPQQALALSNSPLSFDQARSLASHLTRALTVAGTGDDRSFVEAAFQLLLGREGRKDELQVCDEFLRQQTQLLREEQSLTLLVGESRSQTSASASAAQRARENLIHTLMNHNDFVTLR
ncbi:MAG: DUF1553 domain-containing protein [Pirellulaceae bacterium]|nr:DUF1553 domain-containing protein [Pirellulaceae bacterium]